MMAYDIVSARWANAAQTGAGVMTSDQGMVIITPERPALWAKFQEWIAAGNTVAAFTPINREAPRDIVAEFDRLRALLVQKGVITAAEAVWVRHGQQ